MQTQTAVRAAQMGGQVGLKEGLPVTDGRVDILKLWLRLYPGDMHADLRKLNDEGLSKRADFRQVSPTEFVRFWGLMIAGTVYAQRGRDLWENSNMLDGIRDQPQFQKYMAFHRFKITRSLIIYCKAETQQIGLDPWAWFRNGVDDFNRNRRDVLQQGVYQTMDESMSAYKPRKDKLGGLPNITYIHRKPKPLGTEMKTMCDCATGVMVYMEVQEGKNAMREKSMQPNMECLPRVCYEWRRMQVMKA